MYAKLKSDAQAKLRAALVAADRELPVADGRLTLAMWLDEWLKTSVQARCRPRTIDSYRETCAHHIVPAIGRIPLAKLTPEDVARMLRGLTARGTLSPTTVGYARVVLRAALNRAVKSGRVHRNVAALVDAPAPARRPLAPLSAEQARHFLSATVDDRLGPLYALAVFTGMRQGELLGLRWQDVDLDAKTLEVVHSLTPGTRTLAEPKTERARRTLRLGTDAVSALREQRRRQVPERLAAGSRWSDEDFVFATPLGKPLDGINVLHRFQAALAALGLPRQRFHDITHLTATLLLESGEELGVVSKILGHSTITTTADVYAHLTPAMSQRVAETLDGILGSAAAG